MRKFLILLAIASLYSKNTPTYQEIKPSGSFLLPQGKCYGTPKPQSDAPYLTLSFLFWQAKEGQLEYAPKNERVAASPNTLPLDAKIFVPDFAWRPGLKLCFGSTLPYDNWDLNARWTYYQGKFTNIKKTINFPISPPNLGIIPLWSYYFFDQTATDSPRYRHASCD